MGSAFSVLAYKNAVNEADIEEINKPRAVKKSQNVENTSASVIHDCAQSIKKMKEKFLQTSAATDISYCIVIFSAS